MKAIKTLMAAAMTATLALAGGCADNDDLYEKFDDLVVRVDALEKTVNEINKITIPGMQSIVAAIQGNIYVTSVTPGDNGYTITFSDGTTAVITDGVDGEKGDKGDTPVVGVVEADGEFYWAVDGKPLLDSAGNKIPVHSAVPQLRIRDGKWQISYDKGETWADVDVLGNPGGSTISIEDGDTTVTFFINGEAYTIQKELPFYLVFDARKDLGVPVGGDEYTYPYSLKGVSEGDEVEVDILNCTSGWEARVISLPEGEVPGYIGVKHSENATGKVFVYASNGRGKTDIKSLVFEDGVLTAEADVKPVPAAGGEVKVSVTTNMDYELYVDRTQKWISVAPQTKATHVDVYTLVCEANTAGSFRSAEVDVINTVTGETPNVFYVIQYPAETVATDIASLANVADNTPVTLYKETVLATSDNSAVVSDGTSCLYVTGATSALPVGKVITLNGVKKTEKTDEETEVVSVEVTSYEVTAETSSVTAPTSSYLGWVTEFPAYVITSGKLEKEGDTYFIKAPMGQKVVFEAPLASFDLASKVGGYVNVYGYVSSSVYPEGEKAETCSMILNAVSAIEFKENNAWTLSYSTDPEDKKYPEVITNTVSGSTVPYTLTFYSEEDYAKLGGSPVNAALRLSDDVLYYFDLFGDVYGRDEIYDMLVHTDGSTGSDSFGEKDFGKYVAVAAGIAADGTPTGDYKTYEFEKKEPVSVATYADFIGRWKMGDKVLTVSEKVNGSTYNVTGLPNQDENGLAPVEAEFSDGKFILKEQKLSEAWNNPKYGDCDIYLSGKFNYNYKVYAAYGWYTEDPSVILTGYVREKGGGMTVYAGSCEKGKFLSFCLTWQIQAGENAGKGNFWPEVTISDMTKLKEASSAYKAWLGSYTLSTKSIKTGNDTTYNVVLREALPDETIALDGIGIDGIPLIYDAEGDKCSLVYGNFSSSSSYNFYVSGITNDDYVCTGDPDTREIATVTKSADKTIKFENVVYKLSEERPEVYAKYWGVLGQSTSTKEWYTFSDADYIVNPATLTPSAASKSVKSLSAPKTGKSVRFDTKSLPSSMTIARDTKLRDAQGKKVDARTAKSGRAKLLELK